MKKNAHLTTLTDDELLSLIKERITKHKLPSEMVDLLFETYVLINFIKKGNIYDINVGRAIAIRNIAHAMGEYITTPARVK